MEDHQQHKTRKAARSAITGRFVTKSFAKKNPDTTVVSTVHVIPRGKSKKKK